jgi:effector-binding domain-containing protein
VLRPAIRSLFSRVYTPGALTPGHGHNFILYRNETREGCTMTVGVLDRTPGGSDPDVKEIDIPAGRALTATHWGDYGRMRETYDVLHAEVAAQGLTRVWTSLEIYGDWFDDPAKVRTDLYLYLT